MASSIRIKRRVTGSPGAPSALKTAELAYNMVDGYIYVGYGDDGGGNATSVKPFAKDDFNIARRPPTGGAVGAVLTKNTTADYDYSWTAPLSITAGSGITVTSGVVAADATIARLAGPTFTGTVTVPTAAGGDNTTKAASTAYVQGELTAKAGLASPVFTGTPTGPTAATNTNTTQLATTAFTIAQIASYGYLTASTAASTYLTQTNAASTYANLVSPTFTGTVTVPTVTNGSSDTRAASTAFVRGTRLDQLSAPAANVDFASNRITGVADPVNPQDAATKNYVDLLSQGVKPKGAARMATMTNIATLSGLQTIDGIAGVAGDIVLLAGQTTASQNGLYIMNSGAWTRALNMDAWSEVPGAYVLVELGSTFGGHFFYNTNDPDTAGTIGTTAMTWTEQYSTTDLTAGNGITKTGNSISVNYTTGLTITGGALTVDMTVIAPLASPAFTGNPTAPTQTVSDSSTKLATTAWVVAYLAQATIDGGTF